MKLEEGEKKILRIERLERYTLIAPLMDESLDSAKRSQLRGEIAGKSGVS